MIKRAMHNPLELPNPTPIVDARAFVPKKTQHGQNGGFSLVETVLSLGVMAFAFLPLVALLPMGMTTFRKAMDASVATQISQRIVNEAQETDFSSYIATAPAIRYFDDEGEELTGSNGNAPSGAIYQVNVHIVSSPTLPGADSANENLATITIQIANNPGNIPLKMDNSLWVSGSSPSVSLAAYSTVIAGNNVPATN